MGSVAFDHWSSESGSDDVVEGAAENVVRTFPDVRQGTDGAHAQEVVDAAGI